MWHVCYVIRYAYDTCYYGIGMRMTCWLYHIYVPMSYNLLTYSVYTKLNFIMCSSVFERLYKNIYVWHICILWCHTKCVWHTMCTWWWVHKSMCCIHVSIKFSDLYICYYVIQCAYDKLFVYIYICVTLSYEARKTS